MKLQKTIDLIKSELTYHKEFFFMAERGTGMVRQEFLLNGWCRVRVCYSKQHGVFVWISYDFLGNNEWMNCRRGGTFRLTPEQAIMQLRRFRP